MYGTVSYRRKRSASVSAETMRGMMVGTLTLNSSFSEIESSSQSKNLQISLEKIGYKTKLRKYSSGLNAIIIDQQLEGGSDPRREGIALGN